MVRQVSIHAPTWGATFFQKLYYSTVMFQSTHPHGVRRTLAAGNDAYENVSIHAPTWGATDIGLLLPDLGIVSIHAPTWGAT